MTIAGSFGLPFLWAALSDEDDLEGAEPLILQENDYEDEDEDAGELLSDDDEDDGAPVDDAKEDGSVSLEELQEKEEEAEDEDEGFGKDEE